MYRNTLILLAMSFSLAPSWLYGFGFVVQEQGKEKTVSLSEHTKTTLENSVMKVLPKSGEPVQSKGDIFIGTNNSEKNQIQAFYFSTKSYNNLKVMFGENPTEFLTIYVDDVIYGNPNNALFTHENSKAKILLGKGDHQNFVPLSQSQDYITHEMAHFFMDRYFDSHRGEAGVLQEGLSDFFVYMTGDNKFGNDARIDGNNVRSAEVSGEFDDPSNPQTIHELGEYLSAVLFTLSETIGKEKTIEMTVNSIKGLQSQQTLQMFFYNFEDQMEDSYYCDYESALIKHGFVQYIRNQDNHCREDLTQLKSLSKSRYEFDVRNLDISFLDNSKEENNTACGHIASKHDSSESLLLLLCMPFLIALFYREDAHEY